MEVSFDNYRNEEMSAVRRRQYTKQELQEERDSHEYIMKNDEQFVRKKLDFLDCLVYLYEERDRNSTSPSRIALVFHFKHLFHITVEGVIVNGSIRNIERYGLPSGHGMYYLLTPTPIKCVPLNVVNTSKTNKLNNTSILNQRDWSFQLLASLNLDNLVQIINEQRYIPSECPKIEPGTICGAVRNMASDVVSFFSSDGNTNVVANYDQNRAKTKQKKVPVQIPQITVPHVPSEYDTMVRDAVVVRYNKGDEWALLFHFQGDDAFRTIKGVWDENTLKPSFKKERPKNVEDGSFIEIGTIQISPAMVRSVTQDNVYNGMKVGSGATEMEWVQHVCKQLGLLDNWHNGRPWTYLKPPQYTIGPNKTVFQFTLPSSSNSTS